jgi:AAA+ superfamily predicted ATPase
VDSLHDIEVLIESGQGLIVLETEQEARFIEGFRRIATRSSRAYFQWTVTQGLERLSEGYSALPLLKDMNQLFGQILSTQHKGVYILTDFHHYLEDPTVIRHLKDIGIKAPHQALILLSRKISLPEDLKSRGTRFSMPLPAADELRRMVNDLALAYLNERQRKLKVSDREITKRLINALCGLSFDDAERIARHAIWTDGIIDEQDIYEVTKKKFDLLNHNSILSLELDYELLDNVAGLDNLKQWLAVRSSVFTSQEVPPGVDRPKGMLLLGVQGCGKSLAAKAVAGSWQVPLLRFDFGSLYNRFYGQSEENLRDVLDIAEQMQPCVLWIDEIEKALSANSQTDDLSKRMLGTFLTWLSEKKSSVFVVATANDVSQLPPELMRKGRFDEVFFVDLPTADIREKILELHLIARDCSTRDLDLESLARLADGFSGAELEQVVVSALYATLNSERQMDNELLQSTISSTKPLSVLMGDQVSALRAWAEQRTVLA